jgi:hydroxymethylpyrimidine pyrophosphatase-like HAD family hydrolase
LPIDCHLIAVFGNSDGDREMMEWTQAGVVGLAGLFFPWRATT